MAFRHKKEPQGQGREKGWTEQPAKTIWKRGTPVDPPQQPEYLQITHVECGTSWRVRRGEDTPRCPECGKI